MNKESCQVMVIGSKESVEKFFDIAENGYDSREFNRMYITDRTSVCTNEYGITTAGFCADICEGDYLSEEVTDTKFNLCLEEITKMLNLVIEFVSYSFEYKEYLHAIYDNGKLIICSTVKCKEKSLGKRMFAVSPTKGTHLFEYSEACAEGDEEKMLNVLHLCYETETPL